MNLAKQIDQAMKAHLPKAMSQSDLARLSGVPQATISRTLKGLTIPSTDTLSRLARALNIRFSHIHDDATLVVHPIQSIPLITWEGAKEWAHTIDNLVISKTEQILVTCDISEYSYALRVNDDQNEPKLPLGSFIVVDPALDPPHQSWCVVDEGGTLATLKQLVIDGQTRYLRNDNPRYPIKIMQPSARFCGVVKQLIMTLS